MGGVPCSINLEEVNAINTERLNHVGRLIKDAIEFVEKVYLPDLLDALYLTQDPPEVILFAVSIEPLQDLGMELSGKIRRVLPELTAKVLEEAGIGTTGLIEASLNGLDVGLAP